MFVTQKSINGSCLVCSPFRPKQTVKISNFVKNYRTTIKPRPVKGQVIRESTVQYIFCDHKVDSVFISTSVKWTYSTDEPHSGTSGQAVSLRCDMYWQSEARLPGQNDFWTLLQRQLYSNLSNCHFNNEIMSNGQIV